MYHGCAIRHPADVAHWVLGFNYEFNALNPSGKPSELAEAFEKIFKVPEKIPIMMILRNFFPILNIIVSAPGMLRVSRDADQVSER